MSDSSPTSNKSEGSFNRQGNLIKDGFAACLRCGNTGVKDTFYGKGKQYCSQACVRGNSSLISSTITNKLNNIKIQNAHLNRNKSNNNLSFSNLNQGIISQKENSTKTSEILNNLQTQGNIKNQSGDKSTALNSSNSSNFENTQNSTMKTPIRSLKCSSKSSSYNDLHKPRNNSYDWCSLLKKDPNLKVAPVSSFLHVPISNIWDNLIMPGLKLEVKNKDVSLPSTCKFINDIYWVATIMKVSGYYLLLRFEGFDNNSNNDFWLNIFSPHLHHIGWCASQGKILTAPKTIEHKQKDWKAYLMKKLLGTKTLPKNFHNEMKECLKSNLKVGMKLEVVDKTRISSVRVATIDKIIGGRLHVAYDGLDEKDSGFWCHQQSPLIHPVGWAQLVGHELRATIDYAQSSLEKVKNEKWDEQDANFSYFPHLSSTNYNKSNSVRFKKGMKLEAIDPLNLSTICVATVTKVLRNNYLMIGIDGMMAQDGSDWFCYHKTSGNIFPVGFSRLNKLTLTPPRDYNKPFSWFEYLRETRSIPAPVSLFNNDIPMHGFEEGMYIEAVDLMEPRLICVAIIKKVVGRLLKIHFNGWDDTYDQWCDCESVELFPVGWCEIVGYPLEPPKDESDQITHGFNNSSSYFVFDSTIKKRGKATYKGRYKKRKRNLLPVSEKEKKNLLNYKDDDDSFQNSNSNVTIDDENDDCSIFNSIIGSNGWNSGESDETQSPIKKNNNELEDIGCSSVIIKPSPLTLKEFEKCGTNKLSSLNPHKWSLMDVIIYLKRNECTNYCQIFIDNNICGKKLMSLNREDVWRLMDNKLGPSLKVFALLEDLKRKYA